MSTKYRLGKVQWFGGRNRKTGKKNDFGYISTGLGYSYFVHTDNLQCNPSHMVENALVVFYLDSRDRCKEVELLDKCTNYGALLTAVLESDKDIFRSIIYKIDKLIKQPDLPAIVNAKYASLDSSTQNELVDKLGMAFFSNNRDSRSKLDLSKRIKHYLALSAEKRRDYLAEILIDAQLSNYSGEIPISDIINNQEYRRIAPLHLQTKMIYATFGQWPLHNHVLEDFKYRIKAINHGEEWTNSTMRQFVVPADVLFEKDVWVYLPATARLCGMLNLSKRGDNIDKKVLLPRLVEILKVGISDELQMLLFDSETYLVCDKLIWPLLSAKVRFYIMCNLRMDKVFNQDEQKNLFVGVLSEMKNEIKFKMLDNIPSCLLSKEEVLFELYGNDEVGNSELK